VHRADGRPWASATPWHGDEKEIHAETVPLGAVCHLRQAPQNALRELSPTQSVARLLACSFTPFYLNEGTSRVLETFSRVLETVPSFELDFTPDHRAVELCRAQMLPALKG
jgi:hypothetical protein